jgi:hypothetical protein
MVADLSALAYWAGARRNAVTTVTLSRLVPTGFSTSGHLRTQCLRAYPDCPDLSRHKNSNISMRIEAIVLTVVKESSTRKSYTISLLLHPGQRARRLLSPVSQIAKSVVLVALLPQLLTVVREHPHKSPHSGPQIAVFGCFLSL